MLPCLNFLYHNFITRKKIGFFALAVRANFTILYGFVFALATFAIRYCRDNFYLKFCPIHKLTL